MSILRTVTLLLLLALAATSARADGVYIPERAIPALPEIPSQKAAIFFRDGTETLIVESAFQTQSPQVAWILPLPAPPSTLELAEPGTLTSASAGMEPEITHDLRSELELFYGLFAAVAALCLALICFRSAHDRGVALRLVVYGGFVLFMLSAILLPSLGKAGASPVASAESVNVLSAHRLEDADFTVLTAPTADALDRWLGEQNLQPLSPAGRSAAAEYVREHWCFVVGRLHASRGTLVVPRPLLATFPAALPVFPMRMTALANTTTHVELSIIAPQQATADRFHCVAADAFSRVSPGGLPDSPRSDFYMSHSGALFMGHPDLVARMWEGCVVTRLTADLAPAEMSRDVTLALGPLSPHRDSYYTFLSRQQLTTIAGLAAGAAWLILAAWFCRGRVAPTPGQSAVLKWSFALLSFAPMLLYIFLPVIPVAVLDRHARLQWRSSELSLQAAAVALAQSRLVHPQMTPAEVAALPQTMLAAGLITPEDLRNPFTGEPLRAEASPGNFTLRDIDARTWLCTYDSLGIETRLQVLPPLPAR